MLIMLESEQTKTFSPALQSNKLEALAKKKIVEKYIFTHYIAFFKC